LLPALALGAEPPNPRTLHGPAPRGQLIDRGVLTRAFALLGPAEVLVSLGTFVTVLVAGGWRWGSSPDPGLLGTASGAAFAAIVLGPLANAFACRSASRPVWRQRLRGNPLLLIAVAVEIVLLVTFVAVPPIAALLGGTMPNLLGWSVALLAVPTLIIVDGVAKHLRNARRKSPTPSAPDADSTIREGGRTHGTSITMAGTGGPGRGPGAEVEDARRADRR
jgi:magnesium-transporting ATPase (P-type)